MLGLLSGGISCATAQPQSPFFDDAAYLRFGVDPRAEADELVKDYAGRSERLALRIMGHDFTALGFMDRAGRATRARIVTLRGIALALDPESSAPLQPSAHYALLSPPLPDTQDADRDGFEEVFIEKRMPERTCLLVYRVRDVGSVDPLETRLRAFGREHCANAVSDSDGDGRVELTVNVELLDFELPNPPTLRLMLWPDQHRFTTGTGDQLARFVASQQAAREIELEQARATKDSATIRRLAVELAALSQVLGLPAQDQLAELDHALSAFRWSAADKAWSQAARERISKSWKELPAVVEPARPRPIHSAHKLDRPDTTEPSSSGLAERHPS
jgi:hypothetical protein